MPTPDSIVRQGRRRHEVTLSGLTFLGVTLLIMVFAIHTDTNTLYIAFGLMLGGLIASGVLSAVLLHHVTVKRIITDHIVVGEPAAIQYVITNHKRRWPCFAVRIAEIKSSAALAQVPEGFCLHIGPGQSATVTSRLLASNRGIIRLDSIRVTCSFPFGFLNRAIHLHVPEQLVVYPRIGILDRRLSLHYRQATESGTMTANVRGGNDEFYGLREYRAGDNIHSIHWRSSARTQQLMIREMAANAPPQAIIVLNLRNARDIVNPDERADAVERAIELAASLICRGLLENFAVALVIAGAEPPNDLPPPLRPQMGREIRASLLRRLAVIDMDQIAPSPSPAATLAAPNRLAGRAEWIVVTLRRSDPFRDLLPPSPAANFTLLPLDDPDAGTWLRFPTDKSDRVKG
ncbi:MAG: DUF58 domain-containing protein [Phycisphaerales bacterium]|nr:DUF58 domain-containing protein [Phycisphaerales bacterium]